MKLSLPARALACPCSVVPRISSKEKFWMLTLFASAMIERRRDWLKMLTLPPPMYLSVSPYPAKSRPKAPRRLSGCVTMLMAV